MISQKSWILKPNLKICSERHWWSIVRIHQSSDMCAQNVWQALRGAAYTPKGRPSTVEAHCPNKEYPYLHFFFLIYSLFRILPIRNFLHFKIQYKVTSLKTRLFIIANTREDKGQNSGIVALSVPRAESILLSVWGCKWKFQLRYIWFISRAFVSSYYYSYNVTAILNCY